MNKIKHLFLLGFFLFATFLPFSFGQFNEYCTNPDYPALVALYNATNGQDWLRKWYIGDCDICGWEGVACDANNRVTAISLFGNRLAGNLPKELGQLTNLRVLKIGSNQINGNIPSEIGNLVNLTNLDISENSLEGSIPNQIGQLTRLIELYLNGNNLTGSIPSTIGNLSRLNKLSLHRNNLSGAIPSEIGNLNKLLNLDLWKNKLSGNIPPAVGQMNALRNFRLQENQLSGSIPSELGNVPLLGELWIHNNQLSDSIPSSLGNLKGLRSFLVYNNQLTGEIPASLGNLEALNFISLKNNNLTGNIPSEIYKIKLSNRFSSLLTIDFSNNNLDGCYPREFSVFCQSQGRLILTGNPNLPYEGDFERSCETGLGREDLDNDGFCNSEDCNDNDPSVPGIPGLPCNDNNPNTINDVINVDGCSCNGQLITCDHPDYAPLAILYEATDGDNWTTSWDLSDCDVCSYFGITCNTNGEIIEIDLDGNNLTGIIPPEIGEFSNLTGLNLAGNALSGSIPSNIGQLTSLTSLTLTANQLTGSIPSEIGNLIELSSLWLNSNSLSGSIPSSLGNLKRIIFLTLNENNLTGNIPGSLGNLSKGEFLLLEDNNLSGSFPKELSTFGNQREINPNARGGINVANNNLSGCYPIEFKAFCRTDFRLIVDGNENLSDFSEFCFFEDGVCDTTMLSCNGLQFISDNNRIIVSSLSTTSRVEIIGKNTSYQTILICDGDCMENQEINDLLNGDYTVKVNLFDGESYCYREEVITVESSNPIAGTANCSQLVFTGEDGQIILEGLTASYNKVEIIGRNTDWQVISICDGDCPPTLSIPDLESGEYAVKVNQSGNDGSYCYREEQVVVGNNSNDTADCDKLNFIAGNGEITIEGLTASYDKVEIIGRNTDWQVVTVCDGDCNDTQIISDLAAGEYGVKINQGGSNGSYCYREQKVQLENGSSSRNKELDFMDNLVLYPNPARDRVNIGLPNLDIQKGTIHIYNVFGQQVSVLAFDRFNQEVLTVDLDGFENGLYVMTIQIDSMAKFSRRFVVEHLR